VATPPYCRAPVCSGRLNEPHRGAGHPHQGRLVSVDSEVSGCTATRGNIFNTALSKVTKNTPSCAARTTEFGIVCRDHVVCRKVKDQVGWNNKTRLRRRSRSALSMVCCAWPNVMPWRRMYQGQNISEF